MKILFITTVNPRCQGDLLEVSILHGMRELLGDDCVDYPRKRIMYHDFSVSPKDQLHGRGFTLLTTPIEDIPDVLRNISTGSNFDAVIYGDGHIYGEVANDSRINSLANGNYWVLDGHDLYGGAPIKIQHNGEEVIGVQFDRCFKRELVTGIDESRKIFPTGFGIPEERIRPISFEIKDQLYQKTVPDHAIFREIGDLGGGFSHHKFTDENEYYMDLSRSWFGLSSKKGGWDTLRHYEIIAAGALLLFRDYNQKPEYCSPMNLPAVSYSSPEELNSTMNNLVVDGKPTDEYIKLLDSQRKWLVDEATTKARAQYILNIIQNEKDTSHRH